jgi:hypothetical protein
VLRRSPNFDQSSTNFYKRRFKISNGTLLSVLSALARLDVDAWQEAANLARMSQEGAIQRLASLIAELSGGPPNVPAIVDLPLKIHSNPTAMIAPSAGPTT